MRLFFLFIGLFILSFSSVVLLSCQEKNTKLSKALELAGLNRGELEQVLQYYSRHEADSLKLKAARFLIENMPGHYTLISPQLESIRTDYSHTYLERKILDICAGFYPEIRSVSYCKEDVECLTSDFLIRHIEASFALLEKYPWYRDIPFDLFLEYILPYRLENEEVDLWRDSLHIHPDIAASLMYNDDLKYDISRIGGRLNFQEPVKRINFSTRLELLGHLITQNCRDIYLGKEFEYRALGMPAALDYLPFYPNRNGNHNWSVILSPFRKMSEVKGAPNSKPAKIYRRTFSHQLDVIPGKHEYIPDFFLDPFNKDVTRLYFSTADVTLDAREKMPGNIRYAYLCVFNDLGWRPITIGEIKEEKVQFKDMGKDIAYLPVFYKGMTRCDFNYPFVLRMNGRVDPLIPDTNVRINLHLIRKYPYGERVYFDDFFKNIYLQASSTQDFSKADTLVRFRINAQHYIDQPIAVIKKYRYWRIAFPDVAASISELMFWDHDGRLLKGVSDEQGKKCLDGDPLTSTNYNVKEILVDFGEPVNISRIVCLPRGDGNGIYPRNEYELFYYDKNEWRSLGRKVATDYCLDYTDVPSGALFWLRNLTSGVEERIFTYEHGEIRFF